MTEINMEERIAIRDSARTLKKYGSTSSNSSTRQEYYIKHQVSASDTLQGIALKYGVTTEQIRRANKLWANDSLFLRSSLLIPSEGAGSPSVLSPCSSSTPSASTPASPGEVVLSDVSSSSQPPEAESFNDFLVKIDCSIASTKSQVLISQDHSQFVNGEEECIFIKQKALSRLKQQQRANGSATSSRPCNGSDLPTVVTSRGNKVKTSLQNSLNQVQDTIFEL